MKNGDRVKIVDLTNYCYKTTACSVCKPQKNCIGFTGIVTQMNPVVIVNIDNTGSRCKFAAKDVALFKELI